MIDLKINQEPNKFSSFNGIDEAFLPIFISKYLKLNNKLFLVLKASNGAIEGCREPIGLGISFLDRYLAIAFSKIAI